MKTKNIELFYKLVEKYIIKYHMNLVEGTKELFLKIQAVKEKAELKKI